MAWEALAGRLNKLPLLLAGPILREVTPTSVTVWVALAKPADVTLTVFTSGPGTPAPLGAATRRAEALGPNLHMLAITAKTQTLTPGNIYLYDMKFLVQGVAIVTLSEAIEVPDQTPDFSADDPLAYDPFQLPSFCLPPADPNQLRIMHGSCRKPHGEGPDALAILDALIKEKANSANERPQQLLLTGDQIYADDVGDTLLLVLTEAGDTLLGFQEALPVLPSAGLSTHAADQPPYAREGILAAAGFTSEDLRSHLMSLGEYLAMYLFVWSDALWPPGMPAFLDVVGSVQNRSDKDDLVDTIAKREKIIRHQIVNLFLFRQTLTQVRRALANIPTYMICDDHEVTDDWNMTRRFCDAVYGRPLGQRVMTNALTAFALCQAWGNQPTLFDPTLPFTPIGATLLQKMANYQQNVDDIRKIVGIHTASEIQSAGGVYRVFHETASLRYDFKIIGPGHSVIVADTRTWRSFPESGDDTQPDMLGPGELANQLSMAPTDLPKLVIFTTNAPPIQAVREMTKHPVIVGVYGADLYDSWDFPSLIFDKMVVQLSTLCPDQGGTIQGQVVILSGDYHYSFATRLDYTASSRLGMAAKPAKLVIGQLVASPLRNQSNTTLGHQDDGYEYVEHWYQKIAVPDHKPEGWAGWNRTTGSSQLQVGTRSKAGHVARVFVDADTPTLNYELDGDAEHIQLNVKPDYRYRLEYLDTIETGQGAPTAAPIGPVLGETPAERKQAIKQHIAAARTWRDLRNAQSPPPEIVGHNNLGEIRFQWDSDPAKDRRVFQTLFWQDGGKTMWARYDVSLNIGDPKYPVITARDGEP